MTAPHRYQPGNEVRHDSRGRVMRLCQICGKSGRGRMSHLRPDGTPPPVTPRTNVSSPTAVERAQLTRVVERIVEVKVEQPDWRLFAAFHAIVLAEQVRDLDAGLEHALKIAARELDYLLHRRPVAGSVERRTHVPAAPRPSRDVVTSTTIPRIRDDQIRDLVRTAVAQRFEPFLSGGGHLRLVGPDGRAFSVSTTAAGSEAHGYKNARAAARRAGVVIS